MRTFASFLLLGLVLLARAAQAQSSFWDTAWTETSRHYLLRSDLPKADAIPWAKHLDRMYDEYAERMAHLPPRTEERLNVFVFSTREAYQAALRDVGVDATGTGGMFFVNERASGLAFFVGGLPKRRIEHVIQHEGFHQFAWSRFAGNLPIWVNEGLAEFFGQSLIVGDRFVIGQASPDAVQRVRASVEGRSTIPLEQMLAMSGREWNANVARGSAAGQYDQAWSMVHFLVYGDDGKYRPFFDRWLRALNGGADPLQSWRAIFGDDVEGFGRRWSAYAKDAKPGAFVAAMERSEFLAAGALELARRGTVPDSLDALAAALRAIKFEYRIQRHGDERILAADDASLYEIPMDDLARRQPIFAVEPPKRERLRDGWTPTPPSIVTRNLAPFEIRVAWERDRKTGAVAFDLK